MEVMRLVHLARQLAPLLARVYCNMAVKALLRLKVCNCGSAIVTLRQGVVVRLTVDLIPLRGGKR